MYTREEVRIELVRTGVKMVPSMDSALATFLRDAKDKIGVTSGTRERSTSCPGAYEKTYDIKELAWAGYRLNQLGQNRDNCLRVGRRHEGSYAQKIERGIQSMALDLIWKNPRRGTGVFTQKKEIEKLEKLLNKKARFEFDFGIDRIQIDRKNLRGATFVAHKIVLKGARITWTSYSGKTRRYDFGSPAEMTSWAEEHLFSKLF